MRKVINKDHYNFYRWLLSGNLSFKQKEDRIIIRNDVILAVLEYQRNGSFCVVYAVNSRFLGMIITQKTYRKVISMRKFV